jgi:hypothetical protein
LVLCLQTSSAAAEQKKVDFGVPRFADKRDNCFGITQLMLHPMIANLRARA